MGLASMMGAMGATGWMGRMGTIATPIEGWALPRRNMAVPESDPDSNLNSSPNSPGLLHASNQVLARPLMQGLWGLCARWLSWLRVHSAGRPARLRMLERISLGPRQSLILVEADGARLLLATSADGPPAFHPLPAQVRPAAPAAPDYLHRFAPSRLRRFAPAAKGRVSW